MQRNITQPIVWLFLLLIPLLTACGGIQALAGPPTLSAQETRGKALFEVYCSRCHATAGDTVVVGPSLAGIADRAAARIDGMEAQDYLRSSIIDPTAYTVEGFPELVMPQDFNEYLSEDDLAALIAFLLTLDP